MAYISSLQCPCYAKRGRSAGLGTIKILSDPFLAVSWDGTKLALKALRGEGEKVGGRTWGEHAATLAKKEFISTEKRGE